MSGPDLHVSTLKFLALKKLVFPPIKKTFQKFFAFCLPLLYATFQCGPKNIFKNIINKFFVHKNNKKQASKVAHNQPRPFYFIVQPRPQPTAQN